MGNVSINDVADVVKSALSEGFVYRTSKPESDSVTVNCAIRQDEEFKALFTSELWDEFILGNPSTIGSKLSTLFNRKLNYVGRHGLVNARNKYHTLITKELFVYEINHVKNDLIHLAARKLAHGTSFFSEKKMASDKNRELDYIAAKAKITEKLASGLTVLIKQKESLGKICPISAALYAKGFIDCSGVTESGVPYVLSALLLFSLNLFEESKIEYFEITEGLKNIILESHCAQQSEGSSDLPKQEVAEIIFNLSRLAGERLDKCGKISKKELAEMLQSLL